LMPYISRARTDAPQTGNTQPQMSMKDVAQSLASTQEQIQDVA